MHHPIDRLRSPRAPRRLGLLWALGLVASCAGAPAAPEGHVLALRFDDVGAVAVQEIRVLLQPGPAELMARFTEAPLATYEQGGVTVEVDDAGRMVMTITGEWFRANGADLEGTTPLLEIEAWSDETSQSVRPGLTVLATVTAVRDGETIAEGQLYLPRWPLPLGERTQILVSCEATDPARCL